MIHEFVTRGAARDIFRCRDSEVLIAGPAGTGKSRACLEKLHMVALLNPGMRGLIVRKTKASLASSALTTWNRDIAQEAIPFGVLKYFGGSTQTPAQYQYANGSVIELGGMDKPSKIMSTEYDFIYVQEATELTIDDWEALVSRKRNGVVSFQQLLADCNPGAPSHWLKRRCDEGTTRLFESRHTDNPIYANEDGTLTPKGRAYIEDSLGRLSGIRRQRLFLGQWAAAEGLIYDEWDDAIHLVDQKPIPDDWRRWWTIDFGFNNPFVCQHWAEDPDGNLYLYREFYMTQRTVDVHAKDILKVVTKDGVWLEPMPEAIICDHDAENRRRFEMGIGIGLTNAYKSVLDGIESVQERIRDKRIFIMRDALVERDPNLAETHKPMCTAEEITGYIWKRNNAGIIVKEEPVKEHDHGMDAMRYMVAERDLTSRPNVRWM